ncbi:S-Ena type endospore appendage [Halobacillus sp. K22]|uniref:S-Ena type endospore appendage n=1 Tax=Halobacillus sp. K22 TaxID=3457431 RepID=UPI003FCE1F90
MGNCSACCPDQTVIGDIVTDNFCGNFAIPCNTTNLDIIRVWRLDPAFFNAGAQSAATVSVYYDQGCDSSLEVRVTKRFGQTETIQVPRQNTRSITVLDAVSVDIFCRSEQNTQAICRGKYCIDLHYDVLEPPGV